MPRDRNRVRIIHCAACEAWGPQDKMCDPVSHRCPGYYVCSQCRSPLLQRGAVAPNWTIFATMFVERWLMPRFLAALLTEIDVDEDPGYGERAFVERYQLRYVDSGGRLYRQRLGVAGAVNYHEEIGPCS